MNQNFYERNLCCNSISFGFDQFQPPQFPVIHQPPHETSEEMLQARENLMESIQTFLKKFNRISFREMPNVLSLAWEKYFEIQHAFREKQYQPEDIQELLYKLLKDFQIISEELAEYINLPKSLLNRDTSIISYPKFDSLLEEFSGELAHTDLISTKIEEADFDPEEEIHLVEKLFDSLMKDIDIFLTPDDSMPSGIKNDDYDSEGDILFLEELLNEDSFSLPENKSFHFDHYFDPSSPRPPVKPPDDDGFYFDDEPDTGLLTAKVVGDISK
nr:hypothetical protein [Tanacetum cinerariifolium]